MEDQFTNLFAIIGISVSKLISLDMSEKGLGKDDVQDAFILRIDFP